MATGRKKVLLDHIFEKRSKFAVCKNLGTKIVKKKWTQTWKKGAGAKMATGRTPVAFSPNPTLNAQPLLHKILVRKIMKIDCNCGRIAHGNPKGTFVLIVSRCEGKRTAGRTCRVDLFCTLRNFCHEKNAPNHVAVIGEIILGEREICRCNKN